MRSKINVLGIVIFVFAIFITMGIPRIIKNKRYNKFYKAKLNTRIISEEASFGGRTKDFTTKEGLIIELGKWIVELEVGDSIVKIKDSWNFDVFRYDEIDQHYKNLGTYDITRTTKTITND